jgi:hypothetical protein
MVRPHRRDARNPRSDALTVVEPLNVAALPTVVILFTLPSASMAHSVRHFVIGSADH